MTTTHDELVFEYQRTGDSTELVVKFRNFLNKYHNLLNNDVIDFQNYDMRCFLALHINDKEICRSLRRGKFHSTETINMANKALQHLRFKLRKHTHQEIYAEVLIPFLHCAKSYKQMGRGFEKYLYKAYKFELKRRLDEIQLDASDQYGTVYMDQLAQDIDTGIEEPPETFVIHLDERFELSHPQWIHGDKSSEPFSQLKPHERYILAKYYYEDYTDKEIARMLPYNPKSIARIRMRLMKKFHDMYTKGELKWIRI